MNFIHVSTAYKIRMIVAEVIIIVMYLMSLVMCQALINLIDVHVHVYCTKSMAYQYM